METNQPLPSRPIAVAIEASDQTGASQTGQGSETFAAAPLPRIVAAGRGKLAEQILAMAFKAGIKVRQDADLAMLLAKMELDTPIPSEAIVAVAEIMAKVYEANGRALNGATPEVL